MAKGGGAEEGGAMGGEGMEANAACACRVHIPILPLVVGSLSLCAVRQQGCACGMCG